MAYSGSIPIIKSPQYAYALVILSGGVAFIAPQLGAPIDGWLIYALLAALFSFIWPYKAWQWACWLCLPLILLICSDMLITGIFSGIFRNLPILVRVLPSAFLGAYVGSKLSFRKVAKRSSYIHESKDRSRRRRREASRHSVVKEPASPVVAENISSRSSNNTVQEVEPLARSNGHSAALVKAAQEGYTEVAECLVADDAEVNALSIEQSSPLMIAALDGDEDMVRTLFGLGAVPDSSGSQGWTPLMMAAIEGHVEVLRSLLEQGAEVNARGKGGWTALRFAVSMDERETLRLLLKAGADTNVADDEGATALMQAAGENLEESLKALLEAGADPRLKDNKGQTALMIARKRGHTKIIKLLKEAGALAASDMDASQSTPADDSYLYLLKEELEEKLNSPPESLAGDDVISRLHSALQTAQEQIEERKRERSLAPSEISHKLTLTLKEAAVLSGLPRLRLLDAIKAGTLKAQLLMHNWRIKRADLDDYIGRLS